MGSSTVPMLAIVGARVRDARQASGLTQEELAGRACMSRASIANLEAGRQDMPISRLWLLAVLLDVSLASLVED